MKERAAQIKKFMDGKNPNFIVDALMKSNESFRNFKRNIAGKSLEDIAMEYDVDIEILREFF